MHLESMFTGVKKIQMQMGSENKSAATENGLLQNRKHRKRIAGTENTENDFDRAAE